MYQEAASLEDFGFSSRGLCRSCWRRLRRWQQHWKSARGFERSHREADHCTADPAFHKSIHVGGSLQATSSEAGFATATR